MDGGENSPDSINRSKAPLPERVGISDTTSTPHGPTDQRMIDGATGLGQGSIGLVVDASGAPTGYYWTGGYSSTSYSTERPVENVRWTGRSPTMPPCGATSNGTIPAAKIA